MHCLFGYRWNRLENLLEQGRKDRDFAVKDALQPVLLLLLGSDGEDLRDLVTQESVHVIEAFALSSAMDTYISIPVPMRILLFGGNPNGPITMRDEEMKSMMDLRDQVFRIWNLLQNSDNFDPSLLLPILQVHQQCQS